MRKLRLSAGALVVAGLGAATAPAAMIVHDPTSYVQLVQQAQTALDQLESLRTQVDQGRRLVETLDEASGIEDIAALLEAGPWRSALPDAAIFDPSEAALDDLGALTARARQLRDEQRSEEHTPELQSRRNFVCRLLPEKTNITLSIYASLPHPSLLPTLLHTAFH